MARSDVVFVPGRGRVDALSVSVGDVVTPGAPILDLTGTDQVILLEADLDDRARFGVGGKVTVMLFDGDERPGTIAAVRVVKTPRPESGGGAGTAESESVLQVEIGFEEGPDDLVGAPVEVVVAVEERADVLLVPVNALLALADGGYGLEVVRDDGPTEIVRADTGLFADGQVQVSAGGIAEGTVVGVAGR